MSLIRSTSNHEKIYALHDISGHTNIFKGPNRTIIIPIKTFENAVEKWLKNYEDENVEVDGFRISQRFMYGLLTIILSYSGTHIAMSYATFSYMIDGYKFRYYRKVGAIV